MAEKKIRILIIGDELGLGEPLQTAFQKEGFDVDRVMRPDDAIALLQQKEHEYVYSDCMLQGSMNGVDFVLRLRQMFPHLKTKWVLMSGIFTDRDFMKDAIERTGAIAFLEKKPGFDVSLAVKLIAKDETAAVQPAARKSLYAMFGEEKVSTRQKRKIIESLEEVNGFDLPFIYSLLVETGSSGYLNLYEPNGSVSGISISNGSIVGVDIEDRTTFLGEMLIQSGYALPDDVTTALSSRSSQKLGTRLVNANLLSPHAFDQILAEQMNIRLSRTIADHTLRINFAIADVEMSSPAIDSELLQSYLHDWIASKLTTAWLKSLYMMWAGNTILLSPQFKADHSALDMGLVKAIPGLVGKLQTGCSLNQLLSEKGASETALYKGLHFLLTKGLILFGAKAAFRSNAEQQTALRKILNDIQGKNPFEIVDLLGAENVEGANLETLMGPKPADLASPTGMLWVGVKAKIDEAARKALDSKSRERFVADSAGKEAELKLKASQRIEEARKALGLNQYSKALEALLDVQKTFPTMEHLHVLVAWAKIGVIDESRRALQLKEIEFELMQVPAEERYDAHYPFVLGLLHKAKGDIAGAKKQIMKAVAMNPSLMSARRELSVLEAQMKKDKDLFGSIDLKGFVGGLFKKK